jgi:hypothetical protein
MPAGPRWSAVLDQNAPLDQLGPTGLVQARGPTLTWSTRTRSTGVDQRRAGPEPWSSRARISTGGPARGPGARANPRPDRSGSLRRAGPDRRVPTSASNHSGQRRPLDHRCGPAPHGLQAVPVGAGQLGRRVPHEAARKVALDALTFAPPLRPPPPGRVGGRVGLPRSLHDANASARDRQESAMTTTIGSVDAPRAAGVLVGGPGRIEPLAYAVGGDESRRLDQPAGRRSQHGRAPESVGGVRGPAAPHASPVVAPGRLVGKSRPDARSV